MCPVPSLRRTRPAAVACWDNASTHTHTFLFFVLHVLVGPTAHTQLDCCGLILIIFCFRSLSMDKDSGSFASQNVVLGLLRFPERVNIFFAKTMSKSVETVRAMRRLWLKPASRDVFFGHNNCVRKELRPGQRSCGPLSYLHRGRWLDATPGKLICSRNRPERNRVSFSAENVLSCEATSFLL